MAKGRKGGGTPPRKKKRRTGAARSSSGAGSGATGADLVLEHVTMVRRGLTLVDDLSLTVRPGQTLAVTGPSGAGKTTLLRAVSGL